MCYQAPPPFLAVAGKFFVVAAFQGPSPAFKTRFLFTVTREMRACQDQNHFDFSGLRPEPKPHIPFGAHHIHVSRIKPWIF
jgi:hypothetical protein